MTLKWLTGDCRVTLATLEAGSVQACVTSPPFYGLRDYGTLPLVWGGDAECPHIFGLTIPGNNRGGSVTPTNKNGRGEGYGRGVTRGSFCPCGAWSGSLGLEPDPESYLEHLVECFRAVWRVLADTGTCWINMGSSYAGSGNGSNDRRPVGTSLSKNDLKYQGQKPGRAGVLRNGTERTARSDSQGGGSSLSGLCDGCATALASHRNAGTDIHPVHGSAACVSGPSQGHTESPAPCPDGSGSTPPTLTEQSNHATLDQSPEHSPESEPLPVVQESMPEQSLPRPLAECSHCANCDACLSVLGSSQRDVRLCARKTAGLYEPHSNADASSGLYLGNGGNGEIGGTSVHRTVDTVSSAAYPYSTKVPHHPYKPKDEMLIPFRMALALQADGWTLRSVIPWLKRSAMPESVSDRPSSAVEYWFLFSKQARYFWDPEAVRVSMPPSSIARYAYALQGTAPTARQPGGDITRTEREKDVRDANPSGRSRRNSDWFWESWQGLTLDEDDAPMALVVNPAGYSGAHFATFPPRLVEPMVKASTSEKGQCPECGAPWVRVVDAKASTQGRDNWAGNQASHNGASRPGGFYDAERTTTGWRPSCAHTGEPVPQTILDPFGGSGTTGLVADRLGRNAILCELSEAYSDLGTDRLVGDSPMFTEIEVA